MEEKRAPRWCKMIIVGLSALVLVLVCQTYKATAATNELETNISLLCKDAMVQLELELRSEDPVEVSSLYQFYEITQLHPGTTYASLAESLLELEQTDQQFTQADRLKIADGISIFYDPLATQQQTDFLEELPLLFEKYESA
jgi:hypothetical protein